MIEITVRLTDAEYSALVEETKSFNDRINESRFIKKDSPCDLSVEQYAAICLHRVLPLKQKNMVG